MCSHRTNNNKIYLASSSPCSDLG